MSAAEPVIPQQQQADQTLSDSFTSSGSDWNLLGDLMIDLGTADQQQPQPPQLPLKMPATEASVTSAVAAAESLSLPPKPELVAPSDKGLKMKIKRKSKHEEKHEIVAAEAAPARDDSADPAGPNAKKARVDKTDNCKKKTAQPAASQQQAQRDASVNTATVGTSVEPDHLGPCETGTNISLDGIVWLETTTGLLVVNVTWRGRTYVGTLLDSSQHEFAPPCPKDYVPPMETSSRNARGRGKRRPPGYGGGGGGTGGGNGAGVNGVARGSRRLGRQLPLSSRGSDESDEGSRQDGKEDGAKSQSPPAQLPSEQQQSGDEAQLPDQPHIKCPELGCDKRFSQLQALKWHTIRNHGELRPLPPGFACAADLLQVEQLREIKSLDGSSVFKVPQQRLAAQQQALPTAAAKPSPPKTVTVSKTCAVPTSCAQTKPVKKEEKAAPPAQGPFKSIQPKLELLEAAAAAESAAVVNGVATDAAKKKKQRRSPERPPALAPKSASNASGSSGGQRAKCSRRSDPVSPAYSDISDEGSAPLLEKEEPPVSPPPPQPPSTTQPLTSLTSTAPQPKPSVPPPAAIVPPLPQPPRPRMPASPAVSSKPAAAAVTTANTTPRGSPNAPQKPSLGHSPSEDTAKQAEERRQILAENSDIREQQQQQQQQHQHQLKEAPRTPQLQSPSSCRPSSRQSVPPPPISAAAFMGALPPHPMAPPQQAMPPFPPGPGGFPDYRLLGRGGGFDCGQFMPPFLSDKAALEALSYARSSFAMQQHQQQQQQQQHKIHELAAGSLSPGPGKTPPANGLPHHPPPPPPPQQQPPPHMPPHSLGPFHRAGLVEPFMMAPPFSIPSPLMPQPHFLPHK